MKLSVPLIESLGYSLYDISVNKEEPWFDHNEIWFDGRLHRIERMCLFELPFF